jgi:hypothetical protein
VEESDGTKKLLLTRVASYGFGKMDGKTATYEEKLTNLSPKITLSCTKLFDESDLSEEEIKQAQPDNKKDNSNYNDDNDDRQIIKSILMRKKWNKITETMGEEQLVPYDLGIHNCCSVAYRAAATLFGGDISKVRDKVDPSTYNIYGMGVVWTSRLIGASWKTGEWSNDFLEQKEEL